MHHHTRIGHYINDLGLMTAASLSRLVRPASHSRRAEARRRLARQSLKLAAGLAFAILLLMLAIDVTVIDMMPQRGTESLWPLRIMTDFAKSEYVLWVLAIALILVALAAPALHGRSRAVAAYVATRLQFIFLAVLLSVWCNEVLKVIVGRGRPFVGGKANAFNFSPFTSTEAFASFPSGHAVTAFSLAFAVSAIWPRLSPLMWCYALLIAMTRMVLLAHHPSDVVGGALLGLLVAMVVRYWFACRRLGFVIRSDGTIESLFGPSWKDPKRVARAALSP